MGITERAERLAANLLADRQRERPKHDIVACWSCGTTYINRGRHFCSTRCQEWFDSGNPTYEQQCEHERKLMGASLGDFRVVAGPPDLEVGSRYYESVFPKGYRFTPMRRGKEGFYMACNRCNKEFESKGLRCCSTECEKAYRETEERQAVLKEAGIEPASRRMCERPGCDRPIPKWKNGRQVSSKVRFCSDLCRKRAAKAA